MSLIVILAGAVILALAVVGALLFVYDDLAAPPIVISDPVPDGVIVVEITGAVGTPGVYDVPADARIADVIVAAGGVRPDADLGVLNLARRVHDEDELVIPKRQQPTPVRDDNPPPATATATADAAAEADVGTESDADRIDINTASAAELDSLPGIGPVLAQRIIDYRTERGPFQALDELEQVNGISAAMVDELRPLISVGE
jgi:competence protein ComEA